MMKPMRPDGSLFSAYDSDNNWVLEMDLNGHFSFIDFDKKITFKSETPPFRGFQEDAKQGLNWVMQDSDSRELTLRIIEHQCHAYSTTNKSFELELKQKNTTLYQLSGCGSYHEPFGFNERFQLTTINGEDFKKTTKIDVAPELNFNLVKSTNLIEGVLACRSWRSQIDILNRTFVFNYDLAPNMNCIELEALSEFMERIGNKLLHFSFSMNNNTLTLSDKNDTFVFIKMK